MSLLGRRPVPNRDVIPAWAWAYLTEGTNAREGEPGHVECLHAHFLGGGLELWERWRSVVMARWIAERPGSRPWAWYKHECPANAERRKVGGSGDEGAPISEDRIRGYFDCRRSDPPRIESEVTFLKRLGLLEPGEEKRIPRRAWAPMRLSVDEEGWAA